MKAVLEPYLGKTIGINIDRIQHIDAAELVGVADAYFSVRSSIDRHLHHVPYTSVVKIIEDPDGVEIRHLFSMNERFELVVKMGHVVIQPIT